MAFESFGGGGGVSQAISDMNSMSQMNARNWEADRQQRLLPGAIALQNAQVINTMANSRMHDAQAKHMEQETLAQAATAEALSRYESVGNATGGKDSWEDLSSYMAGAGIKALQAGGLKQGLELLGRASILDGHIAAIDRNRIDAASKQMTAELAKPKWISDNSVWVNDQESLDRMSQQYYNQFKQFPPWTGVRYTPELGAKLRHASVTAEQDIQNQLRKQQQEATEAHQKHLAEQREIDRKAREETARIREETRTRNEKAGIQAPSAERIRSVENMIRGDYPKLPINEDARQLAVAVADDAAAIRRANSSISPEQALNTAYQNRKSELSDIMDLETGKRRLKFDSKFTPGNIRSNPIVVPPGKAREWKFQEGKWYIGAGGLVGQYKNGRMEF